jgi:hypothetical protein
MVEALNMKHLDAIAPVSLNNASGTVIEIDTLGFNYAQFILSVGATAGNISVFKIQESDTSGSGFADITGAAPASLPGTSDDNKRYAVNVNCGGVRKRYMQVVLTEDNTGAALVHVSAILSRANEAPNTAAERGFESEASV